MSNPSDSTFMLFCPPMPPLRLSDTSVCIGRHPDCELNLRMDDVSRRHAELRFENGHYVLHDLGSTNGTFVNDGESAAEGRVLSPGDHIQIGETSITFCEIGGVHSFPQPDLDARTVLFDRAPQAPQEAEFRGELREIPAAALFQLMEMNRSTGRLDVRAAPHAASVWFENGQPAHALSEKNAGFDALVVLVGLREGQFCFNAGEMAPEKTIQASVSEVLMEACRIEDESNRGA